MDVDIYLITNLRKGIKFYLGFIFFIIFGTINIY